MYGIIIDYIAYGDYYKIKAQDGIYLAFQKKTNSYFNIGDTVEFQKEMVRINNKILKTAINLQKYTK